jgi:hypothetical protein
MPRDEARFASLALSRSVLFLFTAQNQLAIMHMA